MWRTKPFRRLFIQIWVQSPYKSGSSRHTSAVPCVAGLRCKVHQVWCLCDLWRATRWPWSALLGSQLDHQHCQSSSLQLIHVRRWQVDITSSSTWAPQALPTVNGGRDKGLAQRFCWSYVPFPSEPPLLVTLTVWTGQKRWSHPVRPGTSLSEVVVACASNAE